jgi:signal transduction histidine kinase
MQRRIDWLLGSQWRLPILVALVVALAVVAQDATNSFGAVDEPVVRSVLVALLLLAAFLFARSASHASRMRRALDESVERESATSKVLQVMSRSAFDVDAVFRAILTSAIRICDADWGAIDRAEGGGLVQALQIGGPPGFAESLRRKRAGPAGDALGSRVRHEKRPIHVTDAQQDLPGEGIPGDWYRTALMVPMLREDHVIGSIALYRYDVEVTGKVMSGGAFGDTGAVRDNGAQPKPRSQSVRRGLELRPFSENEISLVQTFADQAAIAIENVRLFNETREALAQQTAIADVLKTISGQAFDLQPVLDAVITSAVRLCGADSGFVFRYDTAGYRTAASFGVPAELVEFQFGKGTMPLDEQTLRRVGHYGSAQIVDVLAEAGVPPGLLEDHKRGGFRTVLGVPMRREGIVLGVISLRRNVVRAFSDREIGLVETFADQAVIAIENARLFNEIQDKGRQLEAASQHKSEFLANMSHELRTPLNAIIGFADVLGQKMFGELNPKQSDYLNDIGTSGRHLLDLVNQILDLSKVEAGRMELEPSTFSPAETIRASLAFVRERAAAHRIQIAADIPADLPAATADERKIRQVLLNLLSNAVKFTPDGGWIGITARVVDGQLEVAVKDTGIGIPIEDQAAVFEEFRQVGQRSDRSREGTGLGLTLAKRFVELHGGHVWLESDVGKGSTFTFAIPVDRPAAVLAR